MVINMEYKKEDIVPGVEFVRFMLAIDINGDPYVMETYCGIISEIYKDGTKYKTTDGKIGYISDLVGHDDYVKCVPFSMYADYSTIDAFPTYSNYRSPVVKM